MISDVEQIGSECHTYTAPTASLPLLSGTAAVTLGKRHRDSTPGNITGVAEGDGNEIPEGNLTGRHTRKRQKLGSRVLAAQGDDGLQRGAEVEGTEEREDEGAPEPNLRVAHFTVYTEASPTPATAPNSSYIDLPPPPELLPEFYPPPPANRPITSTANASENQSQTHDYHSNPFTFSFVPPHPSTPMYPISMTNRFPFPEAPTSPTPTRHGAAGGGDFLGFGMTDKLRPKTGAMTASGSGSSAGFVEPAALMRPTEKIGECRVTSHDIATGLGLTTVRTSATDPEGHDALPTVKKTMYGTELDGDSRFGDFGVEGVASGFWATGRF